MKGLDKLALGFVAVLCSPVLVHAADGDGVQQRVDEKTQQEARVQQRDRIYGSELMTPRERHEYQMKMRSLKTQREREKLRREHHEQMKIRAKKLGKTLPDEPPARGMGAGQGRSGGMGSGAGMGRNRP
ncbi:MAG: hypothetical protein WBX11_12900 [Thiobacillaceae bacterium]